MMRNIGCVAALLAMFLLGPSSALARGGHGGSHSSHGSSHPSHKSSKKTGHGQIKRSAHARSEFKKSHPCPSTHRASGACPGFVIDHIIPLRRNGRDDPSNMQWQTVAEAKAKDKWE